MRKIKKPSSGRIILAAFVTLILFLFLNFLFSSPEIISNGLTAYIVAIPKLLWLKLLISVLFGFLVAVAGKQNRLDYIENKEVGNKQHGSARFMTEQEMHDNYTYVKQGKEKLSGFVVGRDSNTWITETTDKTLCLIAPPGGGKTKSVFIPTIYYNAAVNKNTKGAGASLLLLDAKSENLATTGKLLENSGYDVFYLDFRKPLESYQFNLMNGVNREIDDYFKSNSKSDQLIHYAKAERYAKQVSTSIIKNIMGETKDSASDFFNNTAQGLITGLILLVSQYGSEQERHIISVFKLIVELNGLIDNSNIETGQQRSKLTDLLQYIDDKRITDYVGASVNADVRTSMNVFSSALAKLLEFIDAELEQMICSHSPEINAEDFIKKPTAIFLVCPDEDSSRHFFASLFIRYFTTQLIDLAEHSKNMILQRQVLCLWDEFGNMPAVKDVDALFTAARSRGIRFLYSIQSFSQLKKSYNKTYEEIILDASQILMFTYLAPAAYETAKRLSDILGSQTVLSGTVSRRTNTLEIISHDSTNTYQMMKRPLMFPDEIMSLPIGTYVVVRTGGTSSQAAMKTHLPLFTDYCRIYPPFENNKKIKFTEISYLNGDKIRLLGARQKNKLTIGMFD